MVGRAVLLACLADATVERVLLVGRSPVEVDDPKVVQIVHSDFLDLGSIAPELAGYDACFFCLGVSAAGMTEPAYRRVTYFLTMAAGRQLAAQNPAMRFLYISGAGTDSTSGAPFACRLRVEGRPSTAPRGRMTRRRGLWRRRARLDARAGRRA